MNKKVCFKDLGLIDYKKCWDYQESLFKDILAVKSNNRKDKKTGKFKYRKGDPMPGFEAYPKLAGQNAKYLLAQMNDIFEGRRKNGLSAAMFGIKLMIDNTAKEGDLEAISEYLAQIK